MTGVDRLLRRFLRGSSNFSSCSRIAVTALLLVVLLAGFSAFAQTTTTTISGTVYDPRTTANSLPLPNVLVYATTDPVATLPAGVQCITSNNSTPTGVVAYTYTAVDGTFTLGNIPVNATYTVVIQAGKWRRQFTEDVGATALTGLQLHMPADHTQGDIPMIAIATGSVDALECVLRDMGIADTEFTDDNGTVNSAGHIHLYRGTLSSGAEINGSTPSESTLMNSSTLLNSYDVVMFPCQGGPANQASATGATNLLNYANAGGRIFATHYSFAWLDPNSPYNAQFPPVVNWAINQASPTPDPGVATVNTGFTDGATMAQWLQNAGALYQNTPGQIQISTLRHDFNGVIAPTQSWLTLNNVAAGNPVMQFTFNTPVAAPAANQCGRVLFNEYHVFNANSLNAIFPNECPSAASMSAQAEMLEYAMFDLSSFVTPVVVPTLAFSFNPSPLIVKSGDSADQVTINVSNTSSNTEIFSSVVITLTLPPGLTATALTDSTGGWTCTLGTLTCTRTTSITASGSDPISLTVSVPTYGSGSPTSGQIVATASSPNFSNNVTGTDNVVFQQVPPITWATPANILYGTPLGSAQLNATSTVAGTFSYSPAAGAVLNVGQQTLTATFTPTDSVHYTTATATVTLTVIPAVPTVTLTANSNPVFLLNAVTFTATIPAFATVPTGTVTFYDGTTQLGTGAMTSNGTATFTTTSLSNAVHSIIASYSGDGSYGPATSGALSETVIDFTIAPSDSGKVTVPAAGVATYSLLITPVGGSVLPGTMNLSVTGLSLGSTAVFSPATISAGSGTATVTLQVQLPGKAALEPQGKPFGGGALPLMLSLLLLPFAGRLRKTARQWRRLVVLAVLAGALALSLNGCGGNGKFNASSYSLTVTAASGGLSHATTLGLTVQ